MAIVSPNAARFLVSLFGVSVFGRVLVPVNFRLNAEEIRYIIEHSGSTVLLVDPELDERAARHPGQAPHRAGRPPSDPQLFDAPAARAPKLRVADENATASINYTSGTTARPKGVQLTHRNCWLNAVTFGWHVGVTDRDVYLHTLPTFHCNGWGMPYAVTGMGVRQVIIRKIDGEEILRRIEAEGVTLFNCAPAVIDAVLDAAAARRQRAWRCRARAACGWWSPGRRRRRRPSSGSRPSSAGSSSRSTGSPRPRRCSPSTARPRSGTGSTPPSEPGGSRARACPAVGVRMRVDAEGEVLARSNHVFEGYWNQPEETAKAIDGRLVPHRRRRLRARAPTSSIADRKKDVIITGGENVSSIEVEDCLFQHPAVAEVAVIGVPDEKWGETIKALVVLRPGASRRPSAT